MKKIGLFAVIMLVIFAAVSFVPKKAKSDSLLKGQGPVTVIADYHLKIVNHTPYHVHIRMSSYPDVGSSEWIFKIVGVDLAPRNAVIVNWESDLSPISERVAVDVLFYNRNKGPFAIGQTEKIISFEKGYAAGYRPPVKTLIITKRDVKSFPSE